MWEHVKLVTGCSGEGPKEGEGPLSSWTGKEQAQKTEGKVRSGQKNARLPHAIQLKYQEKILTS